MKRQFTENKRRLSALGWATAWAVTAAAMVVTGGSVAWLTQGSDVGLGVSLAGWLLAGWCTAVHLRGRLSRLHRLRFASAVVAWGIALLFAVGVRIWLRHAFVLSAVNGNLLLAFLAAAAGWAGSAATAQVLLPVAPRYLWRAAATGLRSALVFGLAAYVGLWFGTFLSLFLTGMLPATVRWPGHVLCWGGAGFLAGYAAGLFGVAGVLEHILQMREDSRDHT